MKKILRRLPFIILMALIILIDDQDSYYLDDQILEPSRQQWFIAFLIVFILSSIVGLWLSWGKKFKVKKILISLLFSIQFTVFFFFILFIFEHFITDGILLLNRSYSHHEKTYAYVVKGNDIVDYIEHITPEKDTIFIWLRVKFDDLDTKSIHSGDTISLNIARGLFGLEYVDPSNIKVISKEQ